MCLRGHARERLGRFAIGGEKWRPSASQPWRTTKSDKPSAPRKTRSSLLRSWRTSKKTSLYRALTDESSTKLYTLTRSPQRLIGYFSNSNKRVVATKAVVAAGASVKKGDATTVGVTASLKGRELAAINRAATTK